MRWRGVVGAMAIGALACGVTTVGAATDEGKYLIPKYKGGAGRIATDRPAFSFTTETVAPGHVLLETGYQYTYTDRDGVQSHTHTVPELLGRVGVTDWLELRAQWLSYNYSDVHVNGLGDYSTQVAGDTVFGFKSRLLRHEDGTWRPNLSLIGSVQVPTGSNAIAAGGPFPDIRLPWNVPLTDQLTVYGSLVARVPDTDDGRFFQGGTTLALSYFYTPCTGVFVEYYGLYPVARSEGTSNVVSAGPIVKIFDDVQLDLRLTAGLDDESPDFQTAAGLSFLF